MNGNRRRELESLVSALCDGVLDRRRRARLEQMLRDSPESRAFYLQYVDLHARLSVHPNLTTDIPLSDLDSDGNVSSDDHAVLNRARIALEALDGPCDDELTASARRGSWRRMMIGRGLALMLAMLVVAVGWYWLDGRSRGGRRPVIRQLVGAVTIENSSGKKPSGGVLGEAARIGHRLGRGDRLRTATDDARAVLEYADGTRVVVGFDSSVEIPSPESGVDMRLSRGTVEVDAATQPTKHPLVFATDHARYVVLGTRFRLYRETRASRLELDEGKVRLERQVDGEAVDVEAGFVAVAGSESTPLEVRPLPAARTKLLLSLPKAGQAVTFSAGGVKLATGDWQRGFKTWIPGETAPRDKYQGKIGRSNGLVFVGQTVVQVGYDNRRSPLVLWRPGDSSATTFPLSGEQARSRAIAPDASCVAESDNAGTHVYSIDPAEPKTEPTLRGDLPGEKGKAWCLALSGAGRFAAAGFWDGTLRVYNLAMLGDGGTGNSNTVVYEERLTHTPTRVALSADGGRLAVFSSKDGLLLVDRNSGWRRSLWAAGAVTVTCLKFTPDDKLIAGLSDGTARMWSAADGVALLVIEAGNVPRDVAWSAKGSLLATAAGTVKVWRCEWP